MTIGFCLKVWTTLIDIGQDRREKAFVFLKNENEKRSDDNRWTKRKNLLLDKLDLVSESFRLEATSFSVWRSRLKFLVVKVPLTNVFDWPEVHVDATSNHRATSIQTNVLVFFRSMASAQHLPKVDPIVDDEPTWPTVVSLAAILNGIPFVFQLNFDENLLVRTISSAVRRSSKIINRRSALLANDCTVIWLFAWISSWKKRKCFTVKSRNEIFRVFFSPSCSFSTRLKDFQILPAVVFLDCPKFGDRFSSMDDRASDGVYRNDSICLRLFDSIVRRVFDRIFLSIHSNCCLPVEIVLRVRV